MTRLLLSVTRLANHAATWLARRQTAAQLLAGLVALGLGFWGWSLRFPPADFAGWFNNVFRTLQLITLQFPTTMDAAIPWQLQLARLAVPLVAVLATFNILLGAITRPVRLALLPRMRGHMVVCGAGQLTQGALVTLSERGAQIVVVEPAMVATRREALEARGLTVAEADPRAPGALEALNLRGAAALILAGGEDVENLNLAVLAMAAVRGRPAGMPPLTLALLVGREELAGELDAALDTLSRGAGLRYRRLCPDREALRLELARHAPVFRKRDLDARSHILVVGLHGEWQQALAQLLLAGQDHPTRPPLLTLVLDAAEGEAFGAWRRARPDLDLVAEIATLPRGEALLPEAAALSGWPGAGAPAGLAVVLREDADALATALALRRPGCALIEADAPVLVRQSREDLLLARLAGAPLGHARLSGLVAIGGLIRAESIARVLDHAGEELAMALHEGYRAAAARLPPSSPASVAAWEDLPENLREANRAAAAHLPVLLGAAGLRLAESGDAVALDDALLDRLARIEHRRWMAERIERGWRYGAERDNARLVHPSLRAFEELPEGEREKDREQVRTFWRAVERSGRRVVRG